MAEFYKKLAKKTHNYITLLSFRTVMQSCRFHDVGLRQNAQVIIRFLFPYHEFLYLLVNEFYIALESVTYCIEKIYSGSLR